MPQIHYKTEFRLGSGGYDFYSTPVQEEQPLGINGQYTHMRDTGSSVDVFGMGDTGGHYRVLTIVQEDGKRRVYTFWGTLSEGMGVLEEAEGMLEDILKRNAESLAEVF